MPARRTNHQMGNVDGGRSAALATSEESIQGPGDSVE
jgi:hypothetical protein